MNEFYFLLALEEMPTPSEVEIRDEFLRIADIYSKIRDPEFPEFGKVLNDKKYSCSLRGSQLKTFKAFVWRFMQAFPKCSFLIYHIYDNYLSLDIYRIKIGDFSLTRQKCLPTIKIPRSPLTYSLLNRKEAILIDNNITFLFNSEYTSSGDFTIILGDCYINIEGETMEIDLTWGSTPFLTSASSDDNSCSTCQHKA